MAHVQVLRNQASFDGRQKDDAASVNVDLSLASTEIIIAHCIQKASREPSPNRGASVPDVVAINEERETVAQWRAKNKIDPASQIRLVKLAHMRYQHPSLNEITTFMRDFGMRVVKRTENKVWYRGYGTDPYVYYAQQGEKKYLGGTFLVETYEDLEKARRLSGAGPIERLDEAPGGGYLLTLTDPEGFPVNLLFGQKEVQPDEPRQRLTLNFETEKHRLRKFQRFDPGPAAVHKLGHFGLCVEQFDKQVDWYTKNFNLVPTDFLHVPGPDNKQRNVALFAHIDRGQDYVDHHTFFMTTSTKRHVHHCSFEVHDFDTQQLGHEWLARKGYRSVWGVGRHILGSQIFDYWWDTTGNMVEHYADGDMINEETPIGYGPAGHESLAVWGPEVPRAFLD